MKYLITVTFLLVFVISVGFGQTFSLLKNSDDRAIYAFVLETYLKKNQPKLVGNEILIEYDLLTTSKLSNEIDGIKIRIVSLNKKLFRVKGKEFQILRIVPLRLKEGRFIVTVIEFIATYKKNNIKLINKGGGEFEFNYDCIEKTLISTF